MRKWVKDGWSLRYIFNYALACHASVINNKSAPLPQGENVRPEIERFLRRLGYRLVLKELKYPAQVRVGGKLELSMKWQNVGSAPCYKPYRLAYRLEKQGRTFTMRPLRLEFAREHWLPGSIEMFTPEFLKMPKDLPLGGVVPVTFTFSTLPADTSPGQYTLSICD